MNGTLVHRHGLWTHDHHHHGPHRHVVLPFKSGERGLEHRGAHVHTERHQHGHAHGLVDPSIVRSRDGVRAVATSLAILGVTAVLQAIVYTATHSVALLADLIHNGGDALTAIPLAVAFVLGNRRVERRAGYFVVATIFASACVALLETVDRLVHPHTLDHLPALAVAGLIGFAGNELAARVRLRAGRRLDSPALVADGHHARADGYVSLAVVASAVLVSVGVQVADPIIGLAITAIILRITAQAWRTIREGTS
jgi:cation diffusion facilitator family transporter